jgi:flagellar protein FliO/FliZ
VSDLAAPSYGAQLLQICFVLGGVCLLAFLVLRFGLPRFLPHARKSVGPLKVVQRLPLEPRKALYLVELDGKRVLVGVSDAGPLTFHPVEPAPPPPPPDAT